MVSDQSFREDIQGLRGVAVLSVVLYHTNLALPGGFLGVDVFFVISGYVVTLQMMRHLSCNGVLSLADFYSRRIRRLVPIYLFVIVATIPLTVIFLSPFGEQQEAFSTVRWSAFLVSNYQLMLDDSYQNLVANPFRHLWSLSVEEQFYLVLPPLFAATLLMRWKLGSMQRLVRLAPLVLVVLISGASLMHALNITQFGGSEGAQRWAFFSMPTRLWELGAGVVLALVSLNWLANRRMFGEIAAAAGLITLAFCFVLVDSVSGHPGPVAVVTVGAASLLVITGGRSRVVGGFLRLRPLTYLGDVSYGWYLWHWPLIVFAALIFPDSRSALAGAALLSLLVAAATYQLIENPIRLMASLRGGRAAMLFVGSVASIFILSLVGDRLAGTGLGLGQVEQVEFDFTREFELDQRGGNMDGACFLRILPAKLDVPLFGDVNAINRDCSNDLDVRETDVLLLGDSTALAASDGVFEAGRLEDSRVVAFTAAGCPTFGSAPLNTYEGCLAVQDTYRRLVRELKPRLVVLVNRFDLYVGPVVETGENDHRIRIEGETPPSRSDQNLMNVASSLERFVESVDRSSTRVVVMVQPPPGVLLNRTLFESWFPAAAHLHNTRLRDVLRQREEIRVALSEALLDKPNVVIYDPGKRVCGRSDFCPVEAGSGSFYANSTHLNPRGSLTMVDDFAQMIRETKHQLVNR